MAVRDPKTIDIQWFGEEKDPKDQELEALKESIRKLEDKNKELLEEKRATKTGAERRVMELEQELADTKNTLAKVNAEKEQAIKKAAKIEEESAAAVNAEKAAVSKLLIDNGLTEGLTKIGVKPGLMSAARALLREKGIISIESEGDVRRAVAILKKDGKDTKFGLEDYLTKEFATSEEAKEFIEADAAAGAGAQGGARKAAGKTMASDAFNRLPPKEQAAFIKDGGTLV